MADGCRGSDEILIEKSEKLTIQVISINIALRVEDADQVQSRDFVCRQCPNTDMGSEGPGRTLGGIQIVPLRIYGFQRLLRLLSYKR